MDAKVERFCGKVFEWFVMDLLPDISTSDSRQINPNLNVFTLCD